MQELQSIDKTSTAAMITGDGPGNLQESMNSLQGSDSQEKCRNTYMCQSLEQQVS